MKKLLFIPFFILIAIISFSQEENIVIYDVVDTAPQYPGGAGEMARFIQKNFNYPEEARSNGEQGTVWVEFVVFADGSIGNIKVVKGVSPSLDKEVIRVVTNMPNWIPGIKNGENVNTHYTIPIKAKLAETESKKSKKKKG